MRIHIHHHYPCFEQQLELLIKKISKMGQNIEDIKAALAAADEKVDRVAADVQRLHDLINNMGEIPSETEWQEVKDAVASLNDKLQVIDDETPE